MIDLIEPEMTQEERDAFFLRICGDFCEFIRELWIAIGQDQVAPLGDMELDICRFVADSSNRWRGVLAPRAVGKSWFGAGGYITWRMLRDPDVKILLVSKTKIPGASDTVRLVRGWLSNVWFLKHLDPADNESITAADQTLRFTVNGAADARSPSIQCQGVDGMLTSTRAHLVVADDCETGQNTKTVAARAELARSVDEFCNIAEYGDKEVLYFGTYWHPESLYLKLPAKGFTFRTWPFTYPLPGEKFLGLSPIVAHKVRDGTGKPGACAFDSVRPDGTPRYGPDDIIKRKLPGRLNWEMQHQLLCNLADTSRYPMKLKDLILFEVHRDKAPISIAWGMNDTRTPAAPNAAEIEILGWDGDRLYRPIFVDQQWSPYTETVGYVDPAGRGRDLAGFSVVGQLASYFWVKGCYGFPGDNSSAGMDTLARLARRHGVRTLYYEDNADTLGTWGPLFEAALRRQFLEPNEADPVTGESFPDGWKCSLERDHAVGQKEVRIIESIEPVLSSHRLVVHPDCVTPILGAPKEHELQWQIAALTRERNCFKEDAKVDSLAGAIRKFSHNLRMDPNKSTKALAERIVDERLAAHRKAVAEMRGRTEPMPNYIQRRR